MARKINILEYLPEFLQKYLQLKLICHAENIIFQEALNEIDIINNNQFIITANSQGLKKFEKMLNITTSSNENLENRRTKVLLKWNNTIAYTYTNFLKKLDVICGQKNYIANEYFSDYLLEIITFLYDYGQVDQIEELIKTMIPCNIVVSSKNKMTFNVNGEIGLKACSSYIDVINNSDDCKYTFNIDCQALLKNMLVQIEHINVDDTINHSISNNNNLYVVISNNHIEMIDNSDNSKESISVNTENKFVGITSYIEKIER